MGYAKKLKLRWLADAQVALQGVTGRQGRSVRQFLRAPHGEACARGFSLQARETVARDTVLPNLVPALNLTMMAARTRKVLPQGTLCLSAEFDNIDYVNLVVLSQG